MQQNSRITCPKHPTYELDHEININPNCKRNRFHCQKCFREQIINGCNLSDFIPLRDVQIFYIQFVEDLNCLFQSDSYKDSLYTKYVQIYAPLIENDIDDLIDQAKRTICQQLEQLRESLKPQINIRTQLKERLIEAKQNWSNLIGYTEFLEKYTQIKNQSLDSRSDYWKQLEECLERIIQKSLIQQNDEINVVCNRLETQSQQLQNQNSQDQSKFANLQEILTDIQFSLVKSLTIVFPTQLCSLEFRREILNTINRKVLNSQLLYKLGKDAKDHNLVWQRINSKANTIMFIKLETNQVIGAFTPAIWNTNTDNYVADNSGKSFLFSVSKNQIYPIYQNHQYAIKCNSSYLPTFGGGHDIYLTKEFTLGYSKIGYTYQISQYNPVDNATHLANTASAAIKEFEIYQLIFS